MKDRKLEEETKGPRTLVGSQKSVALKRKSIQKFHKIDLSKVSGDFIFVFFSPIRNGPRKHIISSKAKGPGEQGAAGYFPKILLLKGPKWYSVPSIGVIGTSALEIDQFLRRNVWMISGGPFLSRPLCFTADINKVCHSPSPGQLLKFVYVCVFFLP